jgi:hypothetical protein
MNGIRQFTNAQKWCIRCRLKKKLRLLNEESCIVAARLQRLDNQQQFTTRRFGQGISNNIII